MDGFKAPRLPGANGSNKRKATDDLPEASAKGKQRATVQVSVDDEDEDDFEPAGNDSDYMDEDDEGRMQGGGLTDTQRQILDIFDGQGEGTTSGPAAATVQSVRRQLLNLERAINKNAEMRVKWSGQPEKFVDSEVALDNAIQELLLLTQNPREFYPELSKLGIPASLADLLSHENVDISLAVITALAELTDDDVAEGEQEDDDSDDEAGPSSSLSSRAAVIQLADALVAAQVLELVVNNLSRLNEEGEEAERTGVYQTLSLVENLLSLQPALSATIAKSTTLIAWLLKRLQHGSTSQGRANGAGNVGSAKEKGKAEDPALAQNRHYAVELLAIILQGTELGREARIRFGKDKGIEVCLTVLSAYRKRDPAGAEETEYMENVFDALCSSLSEPENKKTFLEEEGTELMVIMMKDKMLARQRAIKVLDHALTGDAGTEACERFVEVLGLKSLFSAFMNKGEGKEKKKASSLTSEDEEHILSIMVALLTNLASDSIPRMRLLAKFVEDNYSKIDRLVNLRSALLLRVRKREKELAAERRILEEEEGLELDDVEQYLRRLEAGLASLQMADTVLAWCCMEDDGLRDHAKKLLESKGSSFAEVVQVLKEYRDNVGDADAEQQDGDPEAVRQREILGHLIDYMASC